MSGTPELVVFWDGSHQGGNADLLLVPIPRPGDDGPAPAPRSRTPQAARDTWKASGQPAIVLVANLITFHPRTIREIAGAIGMRISTVRQALAQLDARDRVHKRAAEDPATSSRRRGRREVAYWLAPRGDR